MVWKRPDSIRRNTKKEKTGSQPGQWTKEKLKLKNYGKSNIDARSGEFVRDDRRCDVQDDEREDIYASQGSAFTAAECDTEAESTVQETGDDRELRGAGTGGDGGYTRGHPATEEDIRPYTAPIWAICARDKSTDEIAEGDTECVLGAREWNGNGPRKHREWNGEVGNSVFSLVG